MVVGDSIPPGDVHGVSVSLPTWADTVGWSSRDPRILHLMKTGYPRFFIPRVVNELAKQLLVRYHSNDGASHLAEESSLEQRLGLMLQTLSFSTLFKEFLIRKGVSPSQIFVYSVGSENVKGPRTNGHVNGNVDGNANGYVKTSYQCSPIHVVSYPAEHFKLGKAFWQHTGFGISSRCAEYWLRKLNFSASNKSIHEHDLPFAEAEACKTTLQERIASLASDSECPVTSRDVFLYPTGMSAIAHTASAIMAMKGREHCRVAIFGFLYVDTFKVLTNVYDLSFVLYGHATTSEIDILEASLDQGEHISALYLEFPGNPLLKSPDLRRLFALSKKYSFILIVDDTVGTFVNVSLLSTCDVICTSLTKMFSGACNVMGGSITLNPQAAIHDTMHHHLTAQFSDPYFPTDVIIMESNSRDFAARVLKAGANSEMVTSMVKPHATVSHVYYPKGSDTQDIYDQFKRPEGGYGFLLSIIFHEPRCAIAFYDNLDVAKGPSLGTNFTLSCAYTLLAHYYELDWAAEHGVVEYLVRISVGVEEPEVLKKAVQKALDAAAAVASVK